MKINIANINAIAEAILAAEGKANARTLDPTLITRTIERAEDKLAIIPKKYWVGSKITFQPPKVSNSYNAFPAGTWATVVRFSSGWFLTKVWRDRCGSKSYGGSERQYLELSDLAAENMPRSFVI